jgi:hypothetical protein
MWRLYAALTLTLACDTPHTEVVVDNGYARASGDVIYQAFWQAVPFTTPILPGTSSDAQISVFASPNTAYVLLAPGWDPSSAAMPASLVVLESRMGYELHFDTTLHIPVDDTTFAGNCAVGSTLSQNDADFITQNVFANVFANLHYDAATCTTR